MNTSKGSAVSGQVSDDVSNDIQNETRTTNSLHVVEDHVLQERTIGVFGAVSLIVNKIIGAGIFTTPVSILKLSGSVGLSLMLWVIGGLLATCGSLVYLEWGTAIPRSGGIKNYLERSFHPRLLQTCIYMFYCVFLQVSASNAITFSSYILASARVEPTVWLLRGVAIAGAVFSVGIHAVAPLWGLRLQNALSTVKLFTLLFIICCGFAALAGHLRIEKPANFTDAFIGTSSNGYNIGTALLNVIFSFGGYDNTNAVLSEVRNPPKTLRLALPLSIGIVTILYLLTNIAYASFLSSDITVAATLFQNIFGESASVRVLPVLVALSALGHLLGVAFTIPRVIQELAKSGVLPFSDLFMENRPFRTPVYALALHLGVTVLFTCAPPAGDAFNFVVGMSSYPTTVLNLAVTVGLAKLRLSRRESWSAPFQAPWLFVAFYMAGNIFLTVMPFIRPPDGKGNTSLPYWLSSVVPLAIMGLGFIYYTLRFILIPLLFRRKHETVHQKLSDGSTVTRYRLVKR